jgi:hypothetical protein
VAENMADPKSTILTCTYVGMQAVSTTYQHLHLPNYIKSLVELHMLCYWRKAVLLVMKPTLSEHRHLHQGAYMAGVGIQHEVGWLEVCKAGSQHEGSGTG